MLVLILHAKQLSKKCVLLQDSLKVIKKMLFQSYLILFEKPPNEQYQEGISTVFLNNNPICSNFSFRQIQKFQGH
jgi:hypothetical protein